MERGKEIVSITSPLSTDPTATAGAAGRPPVPKKSSNAFFFELYSPQNTGNILSIIPRPYGEGRWKMEDGEGREGERTVKERDKGSNGINGEE